MNNCSISQGSPHLVKTGRHDFSFSLPKGKVRENLGDIRISCKDLNVSFPIATCSLFFTKQTSFSTLLKKRCNQISLE